MERSEENRSVRTPSFICLSTAAGSRRCLFLIRTHLDALAQVLVKTTLGDLDIELWSKETPLACRNFVQLCMEGYYNGTIFHRIIQGDITTSLIPERKSLFFL